MIKAKVVSIKFSESVGGIPRLDLETYLEDPVVQELFCGADFSEGLDVVIMTKKEYCDSVDDFVRKRDSLIALIDENEKLKRENNEKEDKIFKLMLNNDAEQARLKEEIGNLLEENKSMDSSSNVLRQSLLEERGRTKQLEEEIEKLNGENQKERIKELEEEVEKARSESRELMAKNIEIQYDRTITKMTNSRLSENVKEYKETIQKLREENEAIQKDIKDLEEKMAQKAAEVDLCPDGTIVFRTKKVSELEKKVKELEEKNKYLKKRLLARYTVKFDADGAIIYPELKED